MKKSLTLCASILLLSSSAMAMDLDYCIHGGAGHVFVSVGDASGSDTNLMAGTVAATTGHSRSLVHGAKAFVIGADIKFREMFKVGVTAYAPSDDTQYIRDGYANTGSVAGSVTTNDIANDTDGTIVYTFSSITGGTKDVTVAPAMMAALKLQYSLGNKDANFDIGLGLLRSSDKYVYTTQVDNSTMTITFEHDQAVSTSPTAPTAVAGTALNNDETRTWYGLAADVNGKVYGNFSAKASLGYYKTDFEKQTSTVSSDLIIKETSAHAVLCSVGIGFSGGGSDDNDM